MQHIIVAWSVRIWHVLPIKNNVFNTHAHMHMLLHLRLFAYALSQHFVTQSKHPRWAACWANVNKRPTCHGTDVCAQRVAAQSATPCLWQLSGTCDVQPHNKWRVPMWRAGACAPRPKCRLCMCVCLLHWLAVSQSVSWAKQQLLQAALKIRTLHATIAKLYVSCMQVCVCACVRHTNRQLTWCRQLQ